MLVALLAFLLAGSGMPTYAAALQFSRLRTTGFDGGGAVDPISGKFYERSTYDGSAVVRVYNSCAAYESGTGATIVGLTPGGWGTYFAVQNGKIFGRSTSGTTEVRRWSTTGQTELILSAVTGMGGENGNHTFNWGGYTAVNVLNDNGQLYIVGAKQDFSGYLVVKLNPDLTIASTRTVAISYSQGFAFIVRGMLFIGSNAVTPTIQRVVNLVTGQITAVSHSLNGAASWYVGNSFYDAGTDRLYIYNRSSGLYRADNASITLGFLAIPVADAGPDQSALEGAIVQLSAEGSYDRNVPALPLTYSWTQLSGVPVTLSSPATATPTFHAPSVPASGAVLVFQVSVSNNASAAATDTVTVTVGNVNFPPIANAGNSQTVAESSEVTLNGTGSDPDGDALTVSWTQKSGPPVQLQDADTAEASFIAPAVSFEAGSVDLVFTLVVNDGLVNSGPSDVTIHVVNVNAPPVAVAGANQSVNEFEEVTLNGGGSSDPDGNALTYAWTQISGEPLVALSGANTATPSFISPALDLGGSSEGTTLTFRLTVSDGELTSASTVNVRVSNVNHAPIADAGQDRTVPENTLVALDGTGSADTDGDALTYAWEQIDTGFPVVLSNATSASPTFLTPDVGAAGALLRFKLTVNDGYEGVASAEVKIRVTYANRAPVADAGADGVVEEGSTVMLEGAGSDPDGNELQYAWSQVSGPAVTIANVAGATATFTAPLVTRTGGTVVLRFTVTDPYGAEDTDDLAVQIANLNQAPVATAPANLSVLEGSSVELIGQGTDPDSEEQSQLVYQWQQIAPTAQPPVAGNHLSFVAPELEGTSGDPSLTFTFRLTVTDPNGSSASDNVSVTVSRVMSAPIAVANGPSTANEGAYVTLNGSASSDPDGDALSYAWVQTAGPAVELCEANTAMPYFTAPFVSAAGTVLKFRLTVDDGFGGTSSDELTVSVININDPPIVDAARPSTESLWPPDHRMVSITILNVIDTNATIRITGVTQNEPDSSDMGGDVPNDVIISPDGTSVLVRAERIPNGNGRVYCIRFVASDFEQSVPGVVKVYVPKTKKGETTEQTLSVTAKK